MFMNKLEEKISKEKKLIDFIEQNNLEYIISDCGGSKKICIDLLSDDNTCNKNNNSSEIIIQTCKHNIYKIHTDEILYIETVNRKTVIYTIDKKLETSYQIKHWINTLPSEIFAQPHNSFLVNMNYVDEITPDFVILKHKDTRYQVYTSLRKINEFKKSFLEFGKK